MQPIDGDERAEDELDDPRSLALPDWSTLTGLADALVVRSADWDCPQIGYRLRRLSVQVDLGVGLVVSVLAGREVTCPRVCGSGGAGRAGLCSRPRVSSRARRDVGVRVPDEAVVDGVGQATLEVGVCGELLGYPLAERLDLLGQCSQAASRCAAARVDMSGIADAGHPGARHLG